MLQLPHLRARPRNQQKSRSITCRWERRLMLWPNLNGLWMPLWCPWPQVKSRSEEAEASCLLLGKKTTSLTRVESGYWVVPVPLPSLGSRAGLCNQQKPGVCRWVRRLLRQLRPNGIWVSPLLLSTPCLRAVSYNPQISRPGACRRARRLLPCPTSNGCSNAASQSRTVQSSEAVVSHFPWASGEKATALTGFEWPSIVPRDAPVAVSQSRGER